MKKIKITYMVILAIVVFLIILTIDILVAMTTGFIGHAGLLEVVWAIGCIIYIEGCIDGRNHAIKEDIKNDEKMKKGEKKWTNH